MTDPREIIVAKINEVWGRVVAPDWSIMNGLTKKFAIWAANARFDKRVKAGIWDGKIHFVRKDGSFQLGLLRDVLDYLKSQSEYTVSLDPKLCNPEISKADFREEFIAITSETLNCQFIPRDYQIKGAVKSVYYKRGICEHCTSSGKSLTIAMVINYLIQKKEPHKILVLVPRKDLVEQLSENFIEYGIPGDMIGKFVGYQKDEEQEIIVATWQSIQNNLSFVKDFTAIIVDECLDPDTNIEMSDGSYKKIKDIVIGDIVLTKNESTGQLENKSVKDIYHNMSVSEDMYDIEMENGTHLKITGNHKVMTTDGKWIRVDDLSGDEDLEFHGL